MYLVLVKIRGEEPTRTMYADRAEAERDGAADPSDYIGAEYLPTSGAVCIISNGSRNRWVCRDGHKIDHVTVDFCSDPFARFVADAIDHGEASEVMDALASE